MLWSISTFPSWEKRTFIALVDLVRAQISYAFSPVQRFIFVGSKEQLEIIREIFTSVISRPLWTFGSRHQPHHLWWSLQPEGDRGAARNRDQAHPWHHWQEPICGRVPQWEWRRSQAMSQWVQIFMATHFSSLRIIPAFLCSRVLSFWCQCDTQARIKELL